MYAATNIRTSIDQDVVEDLLESYVVDNGATHYKILIEENSHHFEVLEFFSPLSEAETFQFFSLNSRLITITDDGFVFSMLNLTQFFKDQLKGCGWMHFLKLIDDLENSGLKFAGYFCNFSYSQKYHFFSNHPSDFEIISCYVFLPLEQGKYTICDGTVSARSGKGLPEKAILNTVAMYLHKNGDAYCRHLLQFLKSCESLSPYIANFFQDFPSEYEQCLFFAKYSSYFRITLRKVVSLPRRKKGDLIMEERVVNALIQFLNNEGWMHFRELRMHINDTATTMKRFLDKFSNANLYGFFINRPLHFRTVRSGHVYLPSNVEKGIMDNLTDNTGQLDIVIDGMVRKLTEGNPMHFKDLINSSPPFVRKYFKDFSGYQKCLFFEKHQDFEIDVNGHVTLSGGELACGGGFLCDDQEDNPEDSEETSSGESVDELGDNVMQFFWDQLSNSDGIHYRKLADSVEICFPGAAKDYSDSDWFWFFKNNNNFHIGDDGYVTLSFDINAIDDHPWMSHFS